MYKSRLHMVWMGMTKGAEVAKELGLGENYQSWSPLMVHVYQTGVVAGFIGAGLSSIIGASIFWIVIELLEQ